MLKYWIDVTECSCNSPLPIGSCLRCDLEELRDAIWDSQENWEWNDDGHPSECYDKLNSALERKPFEDNPYIKD